MELLYGVKKFNVTASFSGTDLTPGDVTGSINVDIISKVSVSPYDAANELTNFENTPNSNGDSCLFEAAAGDPLIGETCLIPVHRTSFPSYPAPYGVPIDYPTGLTPPLDIIYVDRPGASDWDMDGMFFTRLFDIPGDPSTGDIISFCSASSDPAEFPFFATLILASGVYAVGCSAYSPLVVTLDSASCTITATEWHEYATTAGLPAFNAVTGLPINGGPGA